MRSFFLLALLASTQAINLRDDKENLPASKEEPKGKCETNSDGITFCLSPGGAEWTVDMNHIDREKKTFKKIKLMGPSGKIDNPAPSEKDPKSDNAMDAIEAAKKEKKKEALLQAAARAQKKSAAEFAMMKNVSKNATVNATKNVTANATKNVTANATQNATKNATLAVKK